MRTLWRNEPTMLIGLLRAAIIAAVAFGLPLSGDQQAAVLGLAAAALALSGVNRALVTPVAKLKDVASDVLDGGAREADEILDALAQDDKGD